VIPCLDIKNGRVVKGVRFTDLRDSGDPVLTSRTYEEDGADEITLLDVSATPEGRGHALETVAAVRAVLGIPLTVGGGVRSVDDARALLEAGADRVAVNTAAVEDPSLIGRLADLFGTQCVVVSIDARASKGGWEVVTRSGTNGTGLDVVAWARECEQQGAGEILLTSWDRDGSQIGYDTNLLTAVSKAVAIPIVASGGAGSFRDLAEGLRAGADAVLVASILHEGQTTVADLKRELAAAGIGVRP